MTLEAIDPSVSLLCLVKRLCRESGQIRALANSSSTEINTDTSSPGGSFGHHKLNKEIKALESVQRRVTKMVMAPRLPELKENLDNSLRHVLWFLELFHDRPRRVYNKTLTILRVPSNKRYTMILNYFPYTILGSRSGLNTHVIHSEAVMESN